MKEAAGREKGRPGKGPNKRKHDADKGTKKYAKVGKPTAPAAAGGRPPKPSQRSGAAALSAKRRKHGGTFWQDLDSWKEVDIGDDFLLGAEEGGFAGLEVIDDPVVLHQLAAAAGTYGAGRDQSGTGEDGVSDDGDVPGGDSEDVANVSDPDGEGPGGDPKAARTAAAADADPVAAAAAVAEKKRKQHERLKAKRERRKARRKALLEGGEAPGGGDTLPAAAAAAARKESAAAKPAARAAKAAAAASTAEVAKGAKASARALHTGAASAAPVAAATPAKGRAAAAAAAAAAPAAAAAAAESDDDEDISYDEGSDGSADGDGEQLFDEFDQDFSGSDDGDDDDESMDDGDDDDAPQLEPLPGSGDGDEDDAGGEAELPDMSSWDEFELHPSIVRALALKGFTEPTPIQRECLGPAIRARADVIGAAQTGSGKTLAFGLPIMQVLLQEEQRAAAESGEQGGGGGAAAGGPGARPPNVGGGVIRALILTPTRELALQVCSHLQSVGKMCNVRVVAILGGFSDLKQARLLAKRPAVVVATPGRLWDLMCRPPSSDQRGAVAAAHLADLSRLSFLVLDEADRMVQQGHYKELRSILDRIAPKQDTEDDEFKELREAKAAAAAAKRKAAEAASSAAEATAAGKKRRRAGAAAVAAAEDGEDEEGPSSGGDDDDDNDLAESEDEDVGAMDEDQEEEEEAGGSDEEGEEEQGAGGKKKRGGKRLLQTFVFSATLTLPLFLKKRLRKGGGGAGGGAATLENLMNRIPFRARPRVVDLTTQRKIASGVSEAHITCMEDERDHVLYYLLARHPGRTLVFANAVSAIRRIAALLKLLGMPVHALHAQQQQRQRLKALDRFKANAQAVLLASDVAARGLDVPAVDTVIHYQLPASGDTYIHRCGRTARGAGREGVAIALVSPKEAPRFLSLSRALEREMPPAFPLDLALMPQVRERVKLAIKLDEIERRERKEHAEDSWRRSTAKTLELALSDEEGGLDEEGGGGGKGERRRSGRAAGSSGAAGPEAARLRQELAELISEPLAPKMNNRYFTGGLAAAVATRAKVTRGGKAGTAAGGSAEIPAAAAAAVPKAVALAARLTQSRAAASEEVADEKQRRATKSKKKKAGKQRQGSGSPQEPQQKQKQKQQGGGGSPQAPQQQQQKQKQQAGRKRIDPRLLVSRNQMKKQHKRGMVVIPSAFGRDALAPNALQALRQRVAMLNK